MDDDERYTTVTLDKQSKEYRKVQTTFIKEAGKSVKDIHRVRTIDYFVTL